MNLSEEALIASLKEGNELAYQQLFHMHYELLVSYASKFLPSSDLCREAVQKVFIRLFEKRETLQIKSIKPYLTKSVYHACLEELRSQKEVVAHEDYHLIDETNALIEAEKEAQIWLAIDALPEKCHQIFVMNRFEGLSNQEISERLNLSKRTVETQISLALRKLRDQLLSCILFFV